MSDVLLSADYDLQLSPEGDLLTEDSFDTALLMSIFCEVRAAASEVPDAANRRGWIGNEYTPGYEQGSKLWLYEQARVTRTTLNGAESAIRNGLQWMIDDGLALAIDVRASLSGGAVAVDVVLTHSDSTVTQRRYNTWSNTGAATHT